MTHDPFDTERSLQTAAEQPVANSGNPTEARYRYVLHAIRQLPVPMPPTGFARQMEAFVQDFPEDAGAEQWLLRVAAMAVLVISVATLGPWLVSSVEGLTATVGAVPWRFLGAIIGGLAGFALLDTLRPRYHS